MKPPDQFDSEFLTLISLAPTLDDFQKQIRESRWTAIVIATIFLACGVGFMYTADPPNLERKWWLGFGFAAISVPAIIFSLLAPARWIRSMSLTQTSEIEEILANEKTSKNETVDLWKEVAVILLIFLPLMLVGFSIWNHFGSTWGLVFLVPLMLIVVARHFYMGHRDSAQFAAALDRAFKSSPYKTTGSYVASWADDSFVKQDNSFQLLKA